MCESMVIRSPTIHRVVTIATHIGAPRKVSPAIKRCIALIAIVSVGVAALTVPALGQIRLPDVPPDGGPRLELPDNGLLQVNCPDPAVESLDLFGVETRTNILGQQVFDFLLIARIRNISGAPYISPPNLQAITIYRHPVFGAPQIIGMRDFTDIGTGELITLASSQLTGWRITDVIVPDFEVRITYSPGVLRDESLYNDDCGPNNNSQFLAGDAILTELNAFAGN